MDPMSEGYRALDAGDNAKARDIFWELYSKNPDDPFLELNLAAAFQGLGRMDLAEPFYRKAIEDGKDVVPEITSNKTDRGKSLGMIACTNLRLGLHDPNAC
jgi:tetratricopeptide (TPR) repeat protein